MPHLEGKGEFVVVKDLGLHIFDVIGPDHDSARIIAVIERVRAEQHRPIFPQTVPAVRGETVESIAEREHRRSGDTYTPGAFADLFRS